MSDGNGIQFKTLDSGARDLFKTGARRDTQAGKPRYDLISPFALKRLAELLERGASKYGERNWEKGIEYSRLVSSMTRHMNQFLMGDEEEDHLSAVIFNAMCIVHFQEVGRQELDDLPRYLKKDSEDADKDV